MSRRTLATRAGVDPGYLSQVFAGQRMPTIAVLVALAAGLGGDLALRAYPGTGPRVFDRVQLPIVEALVRLSRPVWRPMVEVAVRTPVRGVIDVVLDRPTSRTIVAAEVQGRIDRLEQQLRWAHEKAESLPSAAVWRELGGERAISRLLVLRSTVATRDLAVRAEATLAAAYPARTADAFEALTSTDVPWPGPAILWADLRGGVATIMRSPPRGVALGR